MPATDNPTRGQTSLEYLLLLAVVAVVVIASFGPGSLIDQIHNAAGGYYNTVTRVIMGENPQKIDGGWCPVTCPASGSFGPTVMYQSCECPAPAFGGKYCLGDGKVDCAAKGVNACGPCPTGQQCVPKTPQDPTGCSCLGPDGLPSDGLHCGLQPDGTIIGPLGSIPDSTCTKCACPTGWYYDQNQNNGKGTCVNYCPDPCTTYDPDSHSCKAVTCGANQFCDTTQKDPKLICACYYGYSWNGYACAPVICTATGSGSNAQCTALKLNTNDGSYSCVSIDCKAQFGFSYCDAATDSCGCDEDPGNNFFTYWNGSACVETKNANPKTCQCAKEICTPSPTCPGATTNNAPGNPDACGRDGCGTYCGSQVDKNTGLHNGNCPLGETCDYSAGSAGTCVSSCSATEIWNENIHKCVPLTPCGSNDCGFDSDGIACGTNNGRCPSDSSGCSSGDPESTPKILPGLCCLACQTLQNGACVTTTPCGIDWNNSCGFDSCKNACGPHKDASGQPDGGCSGTEKCSSTTPNTPGTCS